MNKALYRYEFQRMKYFLYVASGLLLLFIGEILRQCIIQQQNGSIYIWQWEDGELEFDTLYRVGGFMGVLQDWTSFAVIGIVVIAFAATLFRDWHHTKTRELLMSWPCTNRQRITAKLVVGCLSIVALWSVYAIGVLIARTAFNDDLLQSALFQENYMDIVANNSLSNCMIYLFSILAMALAMFMISALMQQVTPNYVLGAFFSVVLSMVPIILFALLDTYAKISDGFLLEFLFNYESKGIEKLQYDITSLLWGRGFNIPVSEGGLYVQGMKSYGEIVVKFLMLFGVAVAGAIGCLCYTKEDLSKRRRLIDSSLLSWILAVGIGIGIGFVISTFLYGMLILLLGGLDAERLFKILLPIVSLATTVGVRFILRLPVRR